MKKIIIDFYKKNLIRAKEHKIISSVIILFLFISFYFIFSSGSDSSISYQYTIVKRGSITSTVSGTGQITPNSQVDLKPKVNANVVAVYVKSGDRVNKGQVLFRLDATDAYKQVRDASTALESAELALLKLKNPKTIDVITINNSIKQEEDSKKNEDIKVKNAYKTLLNANLQAVSEVSYTGETAPTLSGSYLKEEEGQIKISVYQGGSSGYSFAATGLVNCSGQINTIVPQKICDSGLYIKWNSTIPQTNWIIEIPNTQSSNYLANYNSWHTTVTNRDIANAASDRSIESLKQKLDDLTPDDNDIDVRSAALQVKQKQNALYDAQVALSNYTIIAPFDGVMASVSADIGVSAVTASANNSTALGTIVTDKKMAQIVLNESDITKLKVGQKAKVIFDAIDNLEIEGEVVEINTLGTVTSGVVTYKSKIAFATDDVRILPNMSVSVDILTDSKENILTIPNQALKRDKNGYYVEKESGQEVLNMRASSTRRLTNSSSSYDFSSSTTGASSSRKFRNSTGTRQLSNGNTNVNNINSSLIRVPVTISIEGGTDTEILTGLREGETIILKKVTTVSSSNSSAPSITSLFRPQTSTTRTSGGTGSGTGFRAQ